MCRLKTCPMCGSEMIHKTNQSETVTTNVKGKEIQVTINGLSYDECTNKECEESFYSHDDLILYDTAKEKALNGENNAK